MGHLLAPAPGHNPSAKSQELPEEVLRSITRQLIQGLSLDARGAFLARFVHYGDHGADIPTPETFAQWIRDAVGRFDMVYVIVDDLDTCPGLDEGIFMQLLENLGIYSGLFVGLPLLRLWSKEYVCDSIECDEENGPWAECESCNVCFCSRCYGDGIRCDCGR